MKDEHYDIQWVHSDAAPKVLDVRHKCEGTLSKIAKIAKKTCCHFKSIF